MYKKSFILILSLYLIWLFLWFNPVLKVTSLSGYCGFKPSEGWAVAKGAPKIKSCACLGFLQTANQPTLDGGIYQYCQGIGLSHY